MQRTFATQDSNFKHRTGFSVQVLGFRVQDQVGFVGLKDFLSLHERILHEGLLWVLVTLVGS